MAYDLTISQLLAGKTMFGGGVERVAEGEGRWVRFPRRQ